MSTQKRALARDAIKALIVDAARELFVRDGIEAVTMRAIAKRIGYTPTTIYLHFRDKQALLEELCLRDMGALANAFHRIGRIEDPVDRLRRLGMAYIDFAVDYPSHYRFIFMTQKPAITSALQASPDQNAYLMLFETVKEGIAAGQYRPEFDDAHQLAQLMWGALHGIVALQIVKSDEPWIEWRDVRETARAMCDLSMRGVLRA
ncbi:MAG: TetR/AcrR family transcriptional regulator [bacterium]